MCFRISIGPTTCGGSERAGLRVAVTSAHRAVMERVAVGTIDAEFIDLEAALRVAQLRADVSALDRLVSDELLFTGPDGQLGTKAQDLEAHGRESSAFNRMNRKNCAYGESDLMSPSSRFGRV